MPEFDIVWLTKVAQKLNLISQSTYLIPLLIGIRYWHSIAPSYRPLIWFVLIPGCIFGTISEVGRSVWHNNIAFTHIITWLETLLLSWAYYNSLRSASVRTLLLVAVGAFVVLALGESLFLGAIWVGPNIYTHAAQSVLLIGLALLYFEQILRELRDIQLEHDPLFLASVGITLYYAGTITLFLQEESMIRNRQFDQIWPMFIIQSLLQILLNALLALALYSAARRVKTRLSNSL